MQDMHGGIKGSFGRQQRQVFVVWQGVLSFDEPTAFVSYESLVVDVQSIFDLQIMRALLEFSVLQLS